MAGDVRAEDFSPKKTNELTYKKGGHFKRILIFPTTIFSGDMLIFLGG